jgi:rare lipoprotein A
MSESDFGIGDLLIFKNEIRLAGCSMVALVMISIPGSADLPLRWVTQSSFDAPVSAPFAPRPANAIVPTHQPTAKVRRAANFFGIASWYGAVLNGHRTASGEIFDMNRLTAAHRTLPFGTLVRVVDVRSGKSVIVRINDRGVLFSDRVIDLSRAAADQLGIRRSGITSVRLEVLNNRQISPTEMAATQSDPSADPQSNRPEAKNSQPEIQK